jgi:hypothetical protein
VEDAPLLDPVPAGTYWIRTLDCGPVLLSEADLDQGFERIAPGGEGASE